MGRGHSSSSVASSASLLGPPAIPDDLDLPFPPLPPDISIHHLCVAAYDLLVAACRSSPVFASYDSDTATSTSFDSSPPKATPSFSMYRPVNGQSRTKRLLGLTRHHRSPSRTSNPLRPASSLAQLLRVQLWVPDHHDRNLRKSLTRALAGQVGRRPEMVVIPLEHLRHLKPTDFPSAHEYHSFQTRQLRLLEAALDLHPNSSPSISRVREIVQSAELKAIDIGRNPEAMRVLSDCIAGSLAGRHWAGAYPLNLHLYLALLQSTLFDARDETFMLEEADELLELVRRTWPPLGVNKAVHGACLAWVLFRQFVATGQKEQELLRAALAVMEGLVRGEGRRGGRALAGVAAAIHAWSETRLMDYHGSFEKAGADGYMDNLIALTFVTAEVDGGGRAGGGEKSSGVVDMEESRSCVDYYLRSSMRSAFNKMLEQRMSGGMVGEVGAEADESLFQLARDVEELAVREKECFSPVLRRWHPAPTAVAATTLHDCYGVALRQYLAEVAGPTREAIGVLQAAGRLEKVLLQMIADDSGTASPAVETTPYEVEAVVVDLIRSWVDRRLSSIRDYLNKAKEIETWSPISKSETHAQSAANLLKLAGNAVDGFIDIPVVGHDRLAQHLADGLESLLLEYTSFVASCGKKENYIPTLPPLTRCNQDSALRRFWRRASPCRVGIDLQVPPAVALPSPSTHDDPRPSTSRGTQRLYVRLNTLHYLLDGIQQLDRSLLLYRWRRPPSAMAASRFEPVVSAVESAACHVAEVAAYRLMFLDSSRSFYEGLYYGGVAGARVRPALRTLKQNLAVMVAVMAETARAMVVREVMRAAFEAFLLAILAGGPERIFVRSDYEMIMEDLKSLKRVFALCGDDLVPEDVVDREAEAAEGVVCLMSLPTEQLIEDFSIVACEAAGLVAFTGGDAAAEQKVPMPPTVGRWNRTDPSTILRVLCHRDDELADRFLKRTFQLPRRR